MDENLKAALSSHGFTDEEIALGAGLNLDWNTIIQIIATKGPQAIALLKSLFALVKEVIAVVTGGNPVPAPPVSLPEEAKG